MRRLAALALFLLPFSAASAQESTCPLLQDKALANIAGECAAQETGTLCLGGATVTPVFQHSMSNAKRLDEPGDVISIADIDWLSVSSEDRTWGAARALFPAYAGDGLEANDVALLAFGNVALFFPEPVDAPPTLVAVKVTAARGANLRAGPSTNARIIARLAFSSTVKAIGTYRGGAWLLIYAAPELSGWISQSVVSELLEDLPALDADAETAPLWLPWHRFDFRSGVDDAPCPAAPESGILLQSAEFAAPRQFVINGARISLSGTAWLQAQVSGGMLIHVIDGQAQIATAAGQAALSSGKFTRVTLAQDDDDDELTASALMEPEAYDYQKLSGLPIHALPQETRVSLYRYTVVTPAPQHGGSPLEALGTDAPCKFAAVLAGANIRSRPDPEAPVIAVMAYRESAEPIARGIGADSLPWWKLADHIWVRVDATVSGSSCNNLPLIRAES